MSADLKKDLREFHRFITDKLNSGETDLSPEEALDEWRQIHPDKQTLDEDVAAISEALDQLANGKRGISFQQFDRDFRKHL